MDPRSLETQQTDGRLEYLFPGGYRLALAPGFKLASSLPPDRAILYRDNTCLMVIDGGSCDARTLYKPRLKARLASTPIWSADGRYCFTMLDCHLQVVRIDAATSEMVSLTDYPVKRNYKGQARLEPNVRSPFLHDAENHRLVYIEQDYGDPWDARIVSLSLPDGGSPTVLGTLELPGVLVSCDLSLEEERLYARGKGMNAIGVWSLDGQVIESWEPPFEHVWALQVSPDRQSMTVMSKDGGFVYLLESGQVSHKLPSGHGYRWSPDGKMIAFLRRAEEVWIYECPTQQAQPLARIVPRDDAPDWSRDRHYEWPRWSEDSRRLAVGLSTYGGEGHRIDRLTLVFDLKARTVVCLPFRAYGVSWAPIAHPFPRELHRRQP